MSFSKLWANVRRYNDNATVIFDREEPIGRATDLVMPRRRWFRRKNLQPQLNIHEHARRTN